MLVVTDEEERDVVGVDDGVDDDEPSQMVPLSVGRSAAPLPFLLTWNPKLAVWPGCKLPFQPTLVAV